MSVSTEYTKYLMSGGKLPEGYYYTHLEKIKSSVGNVIQSRDGGKISAVGRRIFEYLTADANSKKNFSLVSKGFYALYLDITEEKLQNARMQIFGPPVSTLNDSSPLCINKNVPYSFLQQQSKTKEMCAHQMHLLNAQVKFIESLQQMHKEKDSLISECKLKIISLEERIHKEETNVINYQRQIQSLRNPPTPSTLPPASSPPNAPSPSGGPKTKDNARGFSYQQKKVIEVGIIVAGSVLAYFFPSAAQPIYLLAGAASKLLRDLLPKT